MTKREAKREACLLAAYWIQSTRDNGALIQHAKSDADWTRLDAAIDDLCSELFRRAGDTK